MPKLPIDEFKFRLEEKKQHDFDLQMQEIQAESVRNKNRYDDLLADFTQFKDEVEWLDILEGTFKHPKPIEPKSKTGTGEGTIIAVGSDWHVFETVRPEEVNYKNEYNQDVAKSSIENYHNGILAWTGVHRTALNIKTLVYTLLGDMITCMLHPDQMEGNAGAPNEEVLFCLDQIVSGLDMLLLKGDFDRIVVVCCDGNHSRDSKKPRASGRSVHTLEWLMFKFLERIYADNEKIEFQIADGFLNYFRVYDNPIRFCHGDSIGFQGGIGGLSIPANKACKSWDVSERASLTVLGHFHQTLHPGLFYANGSILGYSPYAVKIKAEYEKPQQGLLVVDSKRFLTSVNKIFVR